MSAALARRPGLNPEKVSFQAGATALGILSENLAVGILANQCILEGIGGTIGVLNGVGISMCV